MLTIIRPATDPSMRLSARPIGGTWRFSSGVRSRPVRLFLILTPLTSHVKSVIAVDKRPDAVSINSIAQGCRTQPWEGVVELSLRCANRGSLKNMVKYA